MRIDPVVGMAVGPPNRAHVPSRVVTRDAWGQRKLDAMDLLNFETADVDYADADDD